MTLLAVESSSIDYGVALVRDGRVLAEDTRRRDADHPGIGGAAAQLMAAHGVAVGDLTRLAVDVGPGNLSSVRAGIAYANGLAFALGLRVVGVDALSLLARGVAGDDPVLALRAAGGGSVYAGLFLPDGTVTRSVGLLGVVVPSLCAGVDGIVHAGAYPDQAAAAVPGLVASGLAAPRVGDLARIAIGRPTGDDVAAATPLTEQEPARG